MIDQMSCMSLHLSLGLGLQALQLTETEATDLSNNINAAKGDCGLVLHKAMQQEKALTDTANSLLREVSHLAQQASVQHHNLLMLMDSNKGDFDCEKGRLTGNTPAARKTRKRATEL